MSTGTSRQTRTEDQITLQWPHKQLRVEPTRPPVQQVERYPPQFSDASRGGLILYGDNFDSLSWLLANGYRGSIRLVYLDPPYNSNRSYTSRIRLRGKGQPTLGELTAYDDIWQPGAYLQFLADRLLLLRDLLHPDGTIWLHCDHRMQAPLLLLLAEIFGPDSHLNTVFWRSQTMRGAKVHARYFSNSAQAIHIFRRTPQGRPVWNAPKREIVLSEKDAAAQFMRDERGFFRTSDPGKYSFERLAALFAEGRLYAPFGGKVIVDNDAQRVYASNGGNIGVKYHLTQRGRNRYILTRPVDNLWDDVPGLGTVPGEDENYPTQKTERLLQRILETASDPADLVLDPFVGSGTTPTVAQKLGRDWIGCDSSWRAVRTAAGRLSRHLPSVASVPSADESCASPEHDVKGVSVRQGSGYQILRLGGEDSVHSSLQWQDLHASPAADIRLLQDDDRLTVQIVQFQSPQVARLAANANVELPPDWRAQARAILIDPDFDGKTLQPELVDAPAGKSALVEGAYCCALSLLRGGHNRDRAPDRSVAILIVDVAGEEHLFVDSTRQYPPSSQAAG